MKEKLREWKLDPDIPVFLLAVIQKGERKKYRRQTQRRSKEIISRIGKGHTAVPGRCEKKDHIYSQRDEASELKAHRKSPKRRTRYTAYKKQNQTD